MSHQRNYMRRTWYWNRQLTVGALYLNMVNLPIRYRKCQPLTTADTNQYPLRLTDIHGHRFWTEPCPVPPEAAIKPAIQLANRYLGPITDYTVHCLKLEDREPRMETRARPRDGTHKPQSASPGGGSSFAISQVVHHMAVERERPRNNQLCHAAGAETQKNAVWSHPSSGKNAVCPLSNQVETVQDGIGQAGIPL